MHREVAAQIQDADAAHRLARNFEVLVKVGERRAEPLGVDALERVEATVTQVTQKDIAIAALVREAQAAAAVPRDSYARGRSMNYYELLVALGLLFLAASFLVTHRTGRTALIVLSCVAFLVAALLTVVGTGVPGG